MPVRARQAVFRRAVFLDRDGTINEDPGYLNEPEQLQLLPSVGEALVELKKAGFLLVVVSNQSGVGRGLITKHTLSLIHGRLNMMLEKWSVRIDHYESCIHMPEDHCECRKPKPKLIFDSANKLNIDISASYLIGDKLSDLMAGRNAGCKGVVLVRTGEGLATESHLLSGEADFIGDSLLASIRWILSQENEAPSMAPGQNQGHGRQTGIL
mgnify:CR=1 FL=1